MANVDGKARGSRAKKRAAVAASVFLALLLLLICAFFAYAGIYYHADDAVWDEAAAYGVNIAQQDGYIACTPGEGTPAAGYVFYPGGKVEAEAYLPYLAAVARQGYFCALLEVPLRLAILDTDAAAGVIAAHPEISVWAVGGHSLGGVAAASYAAEAYDVGGLVLLASYPAGDLPQSGLLVVSITGTNDEVLDAEKYEAAKAAMPQSTEFVVVEGGNHSQFGMYGHQDGDGEAAVTNEEQRAQVVDATVALLRSMTA